VAARAVNGAQGFPCVGDTPAGPRMAGYYASKAYVLSFSKALVCELAGTGVSVTALCPGLTDSSYEARSGAGRTFLYKLLPKMLELEDGTALSESSAIIEYLDHLEGEPVLTGKTAKERGVIAMIQRKVKAGFLDAVAAYFHHSTPGLGPHLETYQNREWGEKNREWALSTLRWMERLLGDQDFLVGERLTSADITAFAGFQLADSVKIPLPDDCPRLRAYRERLARHPSVAAALA
jgi:glutathione S-transferase